ncbi:MAG TPA: serine hydrolase, partial [Acidimicrobiales bacterium]|nr:serine hydrolase [Acidimicrobiales bacterium]
VAGGGALAGDFWPASSIKVLAALGALEFAASLGFTGAATVSLDTGYAATLREIYQSAVTNSDNFDYDVLIVIAGFDRLNTDFLSPANGFPSTVIQRSYAGIDVRWSPEMTFEEGGRTVVVPAREGVGEYECPDEGNCSNLFEMSEAVRRLVLDRSLPAEERFAIGPDDVQALVEALAGTGSFFAPGVEKAVGPGATVLSKPGVAAGLACVDTAVVTAPTGDRYLLSAAIPDGDYDEECGGLSDLAAAVLPLLARQ